MAESKHPPEKVPAYNASHISLMVHILACAIAGLLVAANSNADEPDRPNIIIFYSDDAGYSDFGFQGSETHLTPWIDTLANEGVRFTQAYTSSSVCSPSRTGLLTGRYQNRFGIEFNLPARSNKQYSLDKLGLPPSELTLADLASARGYRTAMIGKWHLGEGASFLPDKRGFGEYFGFLGGSSGYHTGKALRIVSNYKKIDHQSLPYLTDALGDESVAFIERNRDKPFFLYVAFNAPHVPLHARREYMTRYLKLFENRKRAANAALMQSLDDNVGKVLQALQHLGLEENTMVIFANDNGGQAGQNGASNIPLRGVKGTVLEGGLKTPMIIRWPEHLPPGETYDRPVSTLDMFPTVAHAIGVPLPGDRSYDGVDLIPYISDRTTDLRQRTLYWRVNWASAVRHHNWKLIRTPGNQTWLFDLGKDPGESNNLIEQYPSIAESLSIKLDHWEAQMIEPLWFPDPMWKKSAQQQY